MEGLKVMCSKCKATGKKTVNFGKSVSMESECTNCGGAGYTDPPQEILDAIGCERIERKLLENNVGYSFYCSPDREDKKPDEFTIMLYPKKKPNITGRGRNQIDGTTKLEALRKAEEWLDKRGEK